MKPAQVEYFKAHHCLFTAAAGGPFPNPR